MLWDTQHGLDLGPALQVNGIILLDFVQDSKWGGNQKDRIGNVWPAIDNTYKKAKHLFFDREEINQWLKSNKGYSVELSKERAVSRTLKGGANQHV